MTCLSIVRPICFAKFSFLLCFFMICQMVLTVALPWLLPRHNQVTQADGGSEVFTNLSIFTRGALKVRQSQTGTGIQTESAKCA